MLLLVLYFVSTTSSALFIDCAAVASRNGIVYCISLFPVETVAHTTLAITLTSQPKQSVQ